MPLIFYSLWIAKWWVVFSHPISIGLHVISNFKNHLPMNKLLKITAAILLSANCFGQINMSDSTLSVIGYWNKYEKQTYSVLQQKYKIKSGDTTSREVLKYDVDVWIKDSTAKSYTIVWKYKNFDINTDNKFTQKLMSLSNNLDVVIKTDEMGSFQEVVNWKEIRDYINNALETLQKEFKDIPKIKEITNQVGSMFTSKEAIESTTIKEILQIHSFNGAKYKLNEVLNGKQKLANLYGGEPFDADFEIELTTIDTASNSGVVRYVQTVDKKQATNATYEYLKKMATSMNIPEPKREDIPELSIEERTASNIHGPSGWVLYSINVREVTADNVLSVEIREIELK